jgi:hypothetical protein
VQVSDNGPGLPKEALRLIFDPFVLRTDSPVEYGIHLMACYFIVHHHGGRIEARSEEGKGTTFHMRFPLNPNQVPQSQSEHEFLQKAILNEALWQKLISSAIKQFGPLVWIRLRPSIREAAAFHRTTGLLAH